MHAGANVYKLQTQTSAAGQKATTAAVVAASKHRGTAGLKASARAQQVPKLPALSSKPSVGGQATAAAGSQHSSPKIGVSTAACQPSCKQLSGGSEHLTMIKVCHCDVLGF